MTTQGEMNLQGQAAQQTTAVSLWDGTGAQTRIDVANSIVALAHQICDGYVDQLLHVEWQAVSEENMKLVDAELAKLEGRITAAVGKIDDQYKPLSRLWDAYRANFTKAKENLELLKNKVKFPRVKMAQALDARIKAANAEKEKAGLASAEEVAVATAFNQHMMNCMFSLIKNTTKSMYRAFLETPKETFPLFVNNLNDWHPAKVLHIDTVKIWASQFRFDYKHTTPSEPVYDPQQWMNALAGHLMPEKDKLLQLVPMRQAQFESGTVDNTPFMDQANAAGYQMEQAEAAAAEQIQQVQQAATTNAAFEVAATVVVPEQNKGVKKNHVLAPADHEEWRNLVAFWMEKQFPHLNQQELNKKLGFMLTVGNNILKATGEMPKGKMTTVEQFNTRGTRNK